MGAGGIWQFVAAGSIVLNGILLAILQNQLHDGNGLSNLSSEDAMKLGQVFFSSKVSEILMAEEVQRELNFDNRTWEREQYLTQPALDLVSVKLTPEEISSWSLREGTQHAIADRLEKHGVVVLPKVFSADHCREIAASVSKEIQDPFVNFGSIQGRQYRKDYPLPLHGEMFEMLKDSVTLLNPALSKNLGENSILTEFSSLTAYPGASGQRFHSDSSMKSPGEIHELAKLYSAFIYLDDVGETVAPFDVYPGTHTHYHFLSPGEREMMSSVPFIRLAVPQGSIAIYDSRTVHRGGPNTSNLTRPTLYFSLLQSEKKRPSGPTYSLRPTYKDARVTTSDIISGRLPKEEHGVAIERQDDKKCLQSIQKHCPEIPSGEALHQCAMNHVLSIVNKRAEIMTLKKMESARSGKGDEDEEDDEEEDEDEVSVENKFEDGVGLSWRTMNSILPGCFIPSRIEKICQAGVFRPGFETKVTWGTI